MDSADIAGIKIMCSAAAINYPGCNAEGPFQRVLQAKMSIRFCVAATLTRQSIDENNYRQLADPEIARLVSVTKLEEDADLTRAYPSQQGSEVIVTLRNGKVIRRRMADLVPATAEQVQVRFRSAAGGGAPSIEAMVETLDQLADVGSLGALLS